MFTLGCVTRFIFVKRVLGPVSIFQEVEAPEHMNNYIITKLIIKKAVVIERVI